MRGLLPTCASALAIVLAAPAWAQDSGDAPPPVASEVPVEPAAETGKDVYTAADFARFAPKNALDMLRQVPGFTIVQQDQGRGLGQANENVLVNGDRLTSKSESVIDQLNRIPAGRVERIEIVDGASLGIPGLSGQVANVIAKSGEISGRFEYRAIARPRYAEPSFGGGEVSVSGSQERFEWTVAYSHGVGRGGAGGNRGTLVYNGAGDLIEQRDVLIKFVGEFPKLSGRAKWTSPGGTVINANASYRFDFTGFVNDEYRRPVNGTNVLRQFYNDDDGRAYEFGADIDFALGPGRLKLIGLERADYFEGPATSLFIYDDGRPTTGNRFDQERWSGEHIARAEYRWDMLGGNWQLDAEAAFNRYRQVSAFSVLDAAGNFVDVPFPGATGGVKEARYESILTHNRTLGKGLTLQVGAGGEYSKLSQTGPGGLVRTFFRPKGSATVAWTPLSGLDLSLKVARTVGQLSFGDFLASVDLAQNNSRGSNVDLVPQQAWELELEAKKNLGVWGSATVRGYARLIEDLIDFIPVDTFEARGNIDRGRLLGTSINATINLDPLGWRGAKVTATGRAESTVLEDPLTLEDRPFSGWTDLNGEINLRYDVPKSDWAMGAGFNYTHRQPNVRLTETSLDYEGPIYTFGFIENKDVLGMTVNLNVFNLTSGHGHFTRYVYAGPRDRSPLAFREDRRTDVSTIYRLTVKGTF